jgi:hypothetical protein
MGTGTPGREAAFPSSTQLPWSGPRSPGWPVSLFGWAAVSSSRPAQRNGVARRGGQGRAQARPTGLVLEGPEHGARLGRRRDADGLRPARRRQALRTQTSPPWRNCTEHRPAPPIKYRDCRALKQRERAYSIRTVSLSVFAVKAFRYSIRPISARAWRECAEGSVCAY